MFEDDESDRFNRLDRDFFDMLMRIYSFMTGYRWMIPIANVLCISFIVAELYIIDCVRAIAARDDLHQAPAGTLLLPLFLAAIASRVFGLSQFMVAYYAANRAMIGLRQRLMDKILELPKSFFDKHPAGWLIARGTGDMNNIGDFLAFSLMVVFMIISYTLVIGWKVFAASPWLLLIALGLGAVAGLFFRAMQNTIRERMEQVSLQNSRMVSRLAESIRGVKVIKAFAREKSSYDHYMSYNNENASLAMRVVRAVGFLLPSMDFMALVAMAAIMSAGAAISHSNPEVLQGEDLIACLLYMNMMLIPVRMCINIYGWSLSAATSARRVVEILDAPVSVADPEDPVPIGEPAGDLVFDSVSFRYVPDRPVLDSFSLAIPAGQSIAIVGRTGSGKSTLAALTARFYDPLSGTIKLDGTDIRQFRQDELHQVMAMVPQDVYLFSGTIIDNIRFRSPDLTEDEVAELCTRLGTHDILQALPQGYDTPVYEGGRSLSTGQRQIVALSRALAADPRILVLDEATAAVDTWTESIIEQAVSRLIKDRTTIIIAHRLSTVRNADRIIVLEKGEIIEDGSHDELATGDGHYADLLRQAGSGGMIDD
jgi:ABC-type multidrug transport system fused ATPase/permease subunit